MPTFTLIGFPGSEIVGPTTAPIIRGLADFEPRLPAAIHGSFTGDTSTAINGLAAHSAAGLIAGIEGYEDLETTTGLRYCHSTMVRAAARWIQHGVTRSWARSFTEQDFMALRAGRDRRPREAHNLLLRETP